MPAAAQGAMGQKINDVSIFRSLWAYSTNFRIDPNSPVRFLSTTTAGPTGTPNFDELDSIPTGACLVYTGHATTKAPAPPQLMALLLGHIPNHWGNAMLS